MSGHREHGFPDAQPPVALHHVSTGPIVVEPVAEDGQKHARLVVCKYAVGDTDKERVADARELLLTVGLITAKEEQ